MCGRLNVSEDPLTQNVSEALGVQFSVAANSDLRPSQTVGTIAGKHDLHQVDSHWGIKPTWAKKLLINAQAETVATKPTFRAAFAEQRCVVPCSGWYEWSTKNGTKTKYLFEHASHAPLYIAGILFPHDNEPELVTLTTVPTEQCKALHHRMPLLIEEECIRDWLQLDANALGTMLLPPKIPLTIRPCS